MKKILVVDDSLYMRTIISETLIKAGYDVIGQADNGENAIDMAIELNPDLITLDNILPDMIGIDILRVLREEGVDSRVIMVSAIGQQDIIDEGMSLGASAYITKPFKSEYLLEIVGKFI